MKAYETMTAISNFGVNVKGRTYTVTVASDPQRGGYSAKLKATGLGVIMEPNGTSPSDALTRLVRELQDFGDKPLAKEIAKYAWFPLKV